jgi:hypothetical protein
MRTHKRRETTHDQHERAYIADEYESSDHDLLTTLYMIVVRHVFISNSMIHVE